MAKTTKTAKATQKSTPSKRRPVVRGPGGKPQKFTPEQIAAALRATRGLLSDAAKQLGCSRQTISDYLERYPELKTVIVEAREAMLDFAEAKLYQHIAEGSERLLQFHLQTQGRRRGYRTDAPAVAEGAGAIQRVVIEVHKSDDGGEG